MSTNLDRGKIVLPTLENCRWRTIRGSGHTDTGLASCGILGSLIGSLGNHHQVLRAQCEACCESFPPTPMRLNPPLASILQSKLPAIRQAHQDNPRALEDVDRLQKQLLPWLRHASVDSASGLPLRCHRPCHYLGESINQPEAGGNGTAGNGTAGNGTAGNGTAGNSSASKNAADSQHYVCRHPAYTQTTFDQCLRCHDWTLEARISTPLTLAEIVPIAETRQQVRRWAIGVTTSPRIVSTLAPCLQGLIRAGWNDIHLFLDGTVRVPAEYSYLPTTWRERPLGACPAWLLALAELVAAHPHADAYALFQDDVFVHPNAPLREYLEAALWPGSEQGLVSLFNPGLIDGRGWVPIPSDWDLASLALIFPPEMARAFLSDRSVLQRALPREAGRHRPIPELVNEWVQRTDTDVWIPSPSLVEHIGQTSTIWPNATLSANRRAVWFSGDLEQPTHNDGDLAHFDETLFPVLGQEASTYYDRVALGMTRMRRSQVAICGLSRDVRPYLPRTAARIERLGRMFADYRVIIFENDSADRTYQFLMDWQRSNARVDVITASLGTPIFPAIRDLKRAAALAYFRNRYLHRIRETLGDFSHTIVLDTDLIGGWSYEGIANTFGHDDWDFVGSNGLHFCSLPPQDSPQCRHYDRWALRTFSGSVAARKLSKRSDWLKRGEPMHQVESCFGGLGVYRTESIMDCEYGGEDCEHVVLHQRMRRAGFHRIFLNPSQIVVRSPWSGTR